ncbi:MAG: aspartate/glutamate racemase family protein [Deltaproteobacteria bacterium]|nr:aspartate/glutamate racemase family protein [Deltaproteobacteria bacterium]
MGKKTLGILGGMGPLASLAFLQTIYEQNLGCSTEQDYPNTLLLSLSSVPDRTDSLLNNAGKALQEALVRNLSILNAAGVAKIVICCFTSHTLLDRLPKEATGTVFSLVDMTARELLVRREPSLLLASLGSYQGQVFLSTEEAQKAKEFIVLPDEADRRTIHGLIYDSLKQGKDVDAVYRAVRGLLAKYGLKSFIAGCTEFHILTRSMDPDAQNAIAFVDPLFTIARRLEDVLDGRDPLRLGVFPPHERQQRDTNMTNNSEELYGD